MAVKKPQDHKRKYHDVNDLFEFVTRKGDKLEMPYLENVDYGVIEDMMGLSQEEQTKYLLTNLLSEDDYQTLRKNGLADFVDLIEKWNEESAVTLGEL